jgi:hypothetical protein
MQAKMQQERRDQRSREARDELAAIASGAFAV